MCWYAFGHLFNKDMETLGLKILSDYSASYWTNNFSIEVWENPKTSMFMVFGFGGPTLICEFEYTKLPQTSTKVPNIFRNILFLNKLEFVRVRLGGLHLPLGRFASSAFSGLHLLVGWFAFSA